MEDELLALDGAAQVRLHLQQVHGAGVHGLVEDLVAGLAERLGAVHRRVRVAQDFLGPLVAGAGERDADADGREDLVAAEIEGQGQLLLQPLGHVYRLGHARQIFQQHRELVAAEARHRVAGAQADFEAARDADEQLVADHVAETVVDDLEAVEVEEEHGEEAVLATLAALDGELQVIHEERAVRQPRQHVVEGFVEQALFGALAVGDVLNLEDEVDGGGQRVADHGHAQQHPDHVAALVVVALLHLVGRELPVEQPRRPARSCPPGRPGT